MKSKYFLILLFILPFIIYFNGLHAPFIFDDFGNITSNPDIKKIDLKRMLSNKEGSGTGKSDPSRPLTFLTFTLNYHVSGFNPFSYHLFNIALHGLCAIMIFLLSRRILFNSFKEIPLQSRSNKPQIKTEQKWGDFIYRLFPILTALLFAAHPINSEVVNYTSHRSESLATFFYLATILLFTLIVEKGNIFFLFSLLSFVFSLLSKEIAATLPLILLLFDYLFISDCKIKNIIQKKFYHLGYWALLFAFLAFRFFILGHLGDPGNETYSVWNHYTYFLTQLVVVLRYFQLLFFPTGQCIDHFILPAKSIFQSDVIYSLLGLIILLLMAIWIIKKNMELRRILWFSFMWFLITLTPTSSFLPIRDAMAERRLYLPQFGFFFFLLSFCLMAFKVGSERLSKMRFSFLVASLLVYISLLAIITAHRSHMYTDPMALWKEAILRYPKNDRAYNNLGLLYLDEKDHEKAQDAFLRSIELNPQSFHPYYNLGLIYLDTQDFPYAVLAFKNAVRFAPQDVDTNLNLGNALFHQKKYIEALPFYQKTIEVRPNNYYALNSLGLAYFSLGQYEQSLKYYLKAIEVKPDDAGTYYNLGNLYYQEKKYEQSLKYYLKAIEIKNDYASAYNNCGNAYFQLNEYRKALQSYNEAIKLDPTSSVRYKNLGNLYYKLKEYEKALTAFQNALLLSPEDLSLRIQVENLRKIKK